MARECRAVHNCAYLVKISLNTTKYKLSSFYFFPFLFLFLFLFSIDNSQFEGIENSTLSASAIDFGIKEEGEKEDVKPKSPTTAQKAGGGCCFN